MSFGLSNKNNLIIFTNSFYIVANIIYIIFLFVQRIFNILIIYSTFIFFLKFIIYFGGKRITCTFWTNAMYSEHNKNLHYSEFYDATENYFKCFIELQR